MLELAQANQISKEEGYARLKTLYDGYLFAPGSMGVYNPFSLLNTLDIKIFNEYWYSTGMPAFLSQALKQTQYDISKLTDSEVEISLAKLSEVDTYKRNPIPLLYQTGYLTIKEYDADLGICLLGFPNQEVRNGFLQMQLEY